MPAAILHQIASGIGPPAKGPTTPPPLIRTSAINASGSWGGCGIEAADGPSFPQDRAGAEEPDTRDHIGENLLGSMNRFDLESERGEEGGAYGNQGVGAQPCRALPPLALKANQCTQKQCKSRPKHEDPEFHSLDNCFLGKGRWKSRWPERMGGEKEGGNHPVIGPARAPLSVSPHIGLT